ncbi:hypothetical protein TRVA0_031S01464 [Trichomonascus vanleenenianus]|uniref:Mif2p n=1 Tax=Trichomonascus vanleenenianus TaxID=2268995 RepID=UPI003EC9A40E
MSRRGRTGSPLPDPASVGVIGRRAGVKISNNIRKDEYGMEDIDDFFSESGSGQDLFAPSAKRKSLSSSILLKQARSTGLASPVGRKPVNGTKLRASKPSEAPREKSRLSLDSDVRSSEDMFVSRSKVLSPERLEHIRPQSSRRRLIQEEESDEEEPLREDAAVEDNDVAVESDIEEEEEERIISDFISTNREAQSSKTEPIKENGRRDEEELPANDGGMDMGMDDFGSGGEDYNEETELKRSRRDYEDEGSDSDMFIPEKPVKPVKQAKATKTPAKKSSRPAAKPVKAPVKKKPQTKPKKVQPEPEPEPELEEAEEKLLETPPKKEPVKKADRRETLTLDLNGLRRSQRNRHPPVQYWKNEKIVYELAKESHVPIYREVTAPVSSPPPKPKKNRTASKSSRAAKSKYFNPGKTEMQSKVVASVFDYPATEEETRSDRIVSWSPDDVEFRNVKGATYSLATLYDQDSSFTAGGVIRINPNGQKPLKPSRQNSYIFVIMSGSVEASVSGTSFKLAPGGSFEVPRGNFYAIKNLSKEEEARLFFVQATDTHTNYQMEGESD